MTLSNNIFNQLYMKILSKPIKGINYFSNKQIKWYPENLKSKFEETTSDNINILLKEKLYFKVMDNIHTSIYKQLRFNVFPTKL